ncbi:AraC family transcriptional regulator [Paenibacillaceae bacterium]|nr:AraC family transcriptional regulator [Paenibacillaceae bacterium]
MIAKWKSSYYFRLVLSYTALALLLIGITGGYLLGNANKLVSSEVAKDSRYGLLSVKDVVETNFLRVYEDAFFNKVLTTVNNESNEEIKYFLQDERIDDVNRVVRFVHDLELITEMTAGLDGITLFNRKQQYVMNQDRYYVTPDNTADANFLHSLETVLPHQWFLREKPGSPDGKVLTYVFTLPYNVEPSKASGFLYLDISLVHLKEMVRSALSFPYSNLYLFDERGSLLLGGESAPEAEMETVNGLVMNQSMPGQAEANSFSRYDNKVISILPSEDSAKGWTYAIVRPMDSFFLSADKMKRQVWMACLIALLGGVIVSFLMSRQFYIPLKKLLYSIRHLYSGPTVYTNGHEYAVIDHMLMVIDTNMMKMKDQVRLKQITRLITGQQLAAGFDDLPAIPLECRYIVAYLVTEPGESEHLAGLLGKQTELIGEFVPLSAREQALLVFIYDPSIAPVQLLMKALQSMQLTADRIAFGAGIGSVVDSVDAIYQSYQEAVQAHKYCYVRGRDAIVTFEDIALIQEQALLPDVGYELLQHKLLAGSVSEAGRWMDELSAKLRTEPIRVEMVELIMLRLKALLSQVALEQNLPTLFTAGGGQQSVASMNSMFEETFVALKDQAAGIAQHIHDSRNEAQLEKINFLKAHIIEHLADDLSLDLLAAQVNLSANYLSTLFGSVTGESFTEYLNRLRLEQASHLLVTSPGLTVAKIATNIGYRNSQYFCTKFKARFGVTPMQYRNAKQVQERLV